MLIFVDSGCSSKMINSATIDRVESNDEVDADEEIHYNDEVDADEEIHYNDEIDADEEIHSNDKIDVDEASDADYAPRTSARRASKKAATSVQARNYEMDLDEIGAEKDHVSRPSSKCTLKKSLKMNDQATTFDRNRSQSNGAIFLIYF